MNILHVIPSMSVQNGGPSFVVAELTAALRGASVQAHIATTDALNPAQSSVPLAGATIRDFPAGLRPNDISIGALSHPFRLAYSKELGGLLRESVDQADVVHIHSLNLYPQFAAWSSAKQLRTPYIVTPHGALDPWLRGKGRFRKKVNDTLWQRRMLNGASAIHLTTEDERQLVLRMGISAPHVVVPIGADASRFSQPSSPQSFRNTWLGGYNGPLVLNHGRLSDKKGLDILIRALPMIRDQVPARVALIGADDEGVGEQLRTLAKQLGVEEQVMLIPRLSGQDLVDAVASADIWCLPSHTENFGLAVFEAMAASRAVVTSPYVNTATDAAANNSLLMVPNTPEDVATAVSQLLTHPEERLDLGRAAEAYAKRFSWESIIMLYVQMYEDVIVRHGSHK